MPRPAIDPTLARPAGALYIAIILLGLTGEAALRMPLIDWSDPAGTADNILARPDLFRLGILTDAAMAAADVAVAVLLYHLLRPFGPVLATLAAAFRLIQTAVIASGLLHLQSAHLWLTGPGDPTELALRAQHALDLHRHGYDLGLMFFAVATACVAMLLLRTGARGARVIGAGLAAAALVYLAGSGLRFFVPDALDLFAPAYLVPVVAETALALWLVSRRGGPRRSPAELSPARTGRA